MDYSFSFSDDSDIKDTSTSLGLVFSKIKLVTQDNIGAPIQQLFQIPNAGDQIAHTSGQTNIGSRTVTAECIVRRESGANILYEFIDGNSNAILLKNTLISKCYQVFSENPLIRSSDTSTIHITDLNYSFNSNYELNMTVVGNYIMSRDVASGEDNMWSTSTHH